MDRSVSYEEMMAVTAPLETKSEKIRALARRGVAVADIARFLGIRYQHAYNVLKQEGARAPSPPPEQSPPPDLQPMRVSLDAANRLRLPDPVIAALGLRPGDELLLRLEEDQVILFTRAAGARQARELVARYVRSGPPLSEELIEERRRDAEHE